MAEDFEVGSAEPEEKSNRTFVVAAGAVGGLLVLSMICLAVYALWWAPRQQEARNAQATQIILDNTKVAEQLTATAGALHPTNTKAPTKTPVPTATMTPTAVVVVASPTPTSAATMDPGIATAIAQATLAAAQGGGGGGTPTPTALPATGFADEVGLPGLVLLGVLLVVVVIVSRQLRLRSTT
jgi:hypothetical protein